MAEISKKIGLFGGSFNPPHLAHVLVVGWALALGEVDQVWIIPTGGHPFGKELAPFSDRMEMCRRAFACYGERVDILAVEEEPRVHYTVETVRGLGAVHPQHHWRWIMGSDTLEEAHKWRSFDEVMKLAPPLIIPRRGHLPDSTTCATDFNLPDLSSSYIRHKLAGGDFAALRQLVPAAVLDWVREKSLYS